MIEKLSIEHHLRQYVRNVCHMGGAKRGCPLATSKTSEKYFKGGSSKLWPSINGRRKKVFLTARRPSFYAHESDIMHTFRRPRRQEAPHTHVIHCPYASSFPFLPGSCCMTIFLLLSNNVCRGERGKAGLSPSPTS